jgi:hypothetical protein
MKQTFLAFDDSKQNNLEQGASSSSNATSSIDHSTNFDRATSGWSLFDFLLLSL